VRQSSNQQAFVGAPRRRRAPQPLPFVIMAPAAVMLLGAGVAIVVLLLGMARLDRQGAASAEFRAEMLAQVIVARSLDRAREDAVPIQEQPHLVAEELTRAKAAGLLIDARGQLLASVPTGPETPTIALPARTAGEAHLRGQQARYVTVPFSHAGAEFGRAAQGRVDPPSDRDLTLAVVVPVPEHGAARRALLTSQLTFASLLLAAAALVAWTLARDVHFDVLYVRRSITAMAHDSKGSTAPIPVRTIDQVGQLTASFNTLVGRFRAAESAYRQDLTEANAFDQDRSAFLAALSHELRTPLNAILGFTDVLLSELDGPLSEEARENLTIVRTSGNHLRALIDDILALSALESGQFRLSREELDVAQVASDVVTESVLAADQKGIYLELTELSDKPILAYVDRRRLRQIIQNVVSNAVKFTTQGGVVVTLGREGDDIVISVSDTGPGIKQEALENIWNEFSQAGDSSSERQGTGLGLAITRRLVQMHGGSVKVDSVLGQGSTFTVRLPADARTERRSMVEPISEPVIRDA